MLKIDIDGEEYGFIELLSLRNSLRTELFDMDCIEELMVHNTIHSDRMYMLMGLKGQILEQKEALKKIKEKNG